MGQLFVLALTCKLSHFNSPVYFEAKLNGPLKNNKYKLELEENYYGLLTLYKVQLTSKKDGTFIGQDQFNQTVKVLDIVKTSANETTLTVDHSREGVIPMKCKTQTK